MRKIFTPHRVVAGLALLFGGLLIALPADANYPGRRAPLIVDLNRVCEYPDGTADLAFGLAEFHGREQAPVEEKGLGIIEVRTDNRWIVYSHYQGRRGEGHLRLDVADLRRAGIAWDGVRVTYLGWKSNVYPAGAVNCEGNG